MSSVTMSLFNVKCIRIAATLVGEKIRSSPNETVGPIPERLDDDNPSLQGNVDRRYAYNVVRG